MGKEGVKAGLQEEIKKNKDRITGLSTELKETIDVIEDLHDECDFLLKNFQERVKLRGNALGRCQDLRQRLDRGQGQPQGHGRCYSRFEEGHFPGRFPADWRCISLARVVGYGQSSQPV